MTGRYWAYAYWGIRVWGFYWGGPTGGPVPPISGGSFYIPTHRPRRR